MVEPQSSLPAMPISRSQLTFVAWHNEGPHAEQLADDRRSVVPFHRATQITADV